MTKIIKAFVFFFVLFVVSPALANDVKTMPGTACRAANDRIQGGYPWYATAPGTALMTPADHNYSLGIADLNDFSPIQFVSFACPIVRDYTTNISGFNYVKVYVQDYSATASISCTVLMESSDLHTSYVTQLDTGVAFQTPIGQSTLLTFDHTMLTTSWSRGLSNLACTISPKDAIIGYAWSELGPGDAS